MSNINEFIDYVKVIFGKQKHEKHMIEYDYVDTFNYEEMQLIFKHKIGIFSFPLFCIRFVENYLKKKMKL